MDSDQRFLIELKPPDDYQKYQKKKVETVNLLVDQWKQSELELAGLRKK